MEYIKIILLSFFIMSEAVHASDEYSAGTGNPDMSGNRTESTLEISGNYIPNPIERPNPGPSAADRANLDLERAAVRNRAGCISRCINTMPQVVAYGVLGCCSFGFVGFIFYLSGAANYITV